jgi:hypothetical protein
MKRIAPILFVVAIGAVLLWRSPVSAGVAVGIQIGIPLPLPPPIVVSPWPYQPVYVPPPVVTVPVPYYAPPVPYRKHGGYRRAYTSGCGYGGRWDKGGRHRHRHWDDDD